MVPISETTTINPELYQGLLSEVGASDRALAVLAGAMLDDRVKSLLLRYLLPPLKATDDKLFGRSGPLDSFASRTELARRLHLIEGDDARALDIIRTIRNGAAHETTFSFSMNSMTDYVANLVKALKLKEQVPEMLAMNESPKQRFLLSFLIMSTHLDLELTKITRTTQRPWATAKSVKWNPKGDHIDA